MENRKQSSLLSGRLTPDAAHSTRRLTTATRRMQWSGAAITLSLMLCLQVPPNLSSASAAESFEYQFLAASDAAMKKMMKDMTIEKSGNIDRDFINMMIPHHQGAIDMARAELLFGKNEQLRRIAQEIVVAQQQEIVAMRLAIPATPAMPLAEK